MKWIIAVRQQRHYKIEVEADSYEAALNAGYIAAQEPNSTEFKYLADPIQQLGEPWLKFGEWYDLHGPGDVIVCERAIGNAFTKSDIDIIRSRLESLGLKVVDAWNGDGCSTSSFRCTGRVGTKQFTDEQLKILHAPRPEST